MPQGGRGRNPGRSAGHVHGPSEHVFPEAYLESRKKVSTVTQKTNLDVDSYTFFTSKGAQNLKNTLTNQDCQQNESQNPASAYKILEAYFESRKTSVDSYTL